MSSSPAPAAMPAPSPREHVERIRRERYFIGRDEQNPLAEDMHEAVNYLSQELYSKDVHFLMELVQNAEDNKYPCEVVPSLEFLITSKDITRSGASSTLLIFNNERGFSSTNIESICRVGKSTKKGNRHQGYIGEKGIGFKSVFLISSQPHIFSNGYHIKFNEKPCAECNIGYIVPEWVESTPRLSDIEAIYGCFKVLPTTTIILPLKNEKVDAVKKQLSSLHPEMLLFLSKIRKLSVREDNSIPESSTVTEIAISIENNFQSRKSMHAESYTLNLSAEESGKMEEECGYYVWRQKFPVKAENKVEKRDKIDEWVITLAFPLGERLSREKKLLPGVYAFLPTEMITDFPFIIQADFLLSSSREAILFDSPWNKGILECVPTAFMSAFVTLVKSTPDAPAMSLPSMFNFLPVNPSVISLLEPVRSGIKEKVLAEDIVPCESYASQKIFCKAGEVSRLKTEFWTILHNAREFGVDLKNLSITNWLQKYAKVEFVSVYTYGSTVVESLSNAKRPVISFAHFLYHSDKESHIDDYYLQQLCCAMPLIDSYGNAVTSRNSIMVPASGSKWVELMGTNPWRKDGYIELSADYKLAGYFAGNYTSEYQLLEFLKEHLQASDVPQINPPNSSFPTVSSPLTVDNALLLLEWIQNRKTCGVRLPDQFLASVKGGSWLMTSVGYMPPKESFLSSAKWGSILHNASSLVDIPMIDQQFYRNKLDIYTDELKLIGVRFEFQEASAYIGHCLLSKSARNALTTENVYSLLRLIRYLGEDSYKEELKKTGLIMRFEEASNAITQIFKEMVSKSSLTKASVLALLGSYRQLRTHSPLPVALFNCMRSEKWLHTSVGFRSPSEAILFYDTWQPLSPIANLPFINVGDSCHGLGTEIYSYKDELEELGVTVEVQNGARFVISGLSIPSDPSIMSKATVMSLLTCIKSYIECGASLPKGFQDEISKKWVKTSMGYQCPDECILFDAKKSSLCMEDGPFIDEAIYGSELVSFKDSLARIGVIVNVNCGQDLVATHLRSHKVRTTISRIYMYLMNCKWKPNDKEKNNNWIWIPKEPEDGEWVRSEFCVLSDKNNLFSQQIHVLDKYYDKKLLEFFSLAFGVRHGPDSEDYCKLWITWEKSVHELTISDCSAFWMFVATNWSKNTQKLLSDCVKVPVCADGMITLSKKEDVFIPDDLLLTDLFKKLPQQSLFIWYPPSTMPSMSRARLNSIYEGIGVQRISKAVMKNDSFTLENGCFRTVDAIKVIEVGLLRIILMFLADPALDIPAKERHKMVSCLLNVTVQETDQPITVSYKVILSSGEVVNVKDSRMLRWERERSELYMQSREGVSGYKEKIEFATYFAEEISRGILFEMADQIASLSDLIKFGSLLNFEDAAIGFLMKSKNLQLFPEDDDFLKSSVLCLCPEN
ncbi:hypothetical protein HU200_038435 [Digitaria exilis]|uniref:Sacsin/Nov domain-containing protein n=1 Tax=Digitaria exilis TaxID=1010633 RepID=A0A835BKI8_9POAL|nr:hypothetical protein HU200_038435 [Digitaria exilis]